MSVLRKSDSLIEYLNEMKKIYECPLCFDTLQKPSILPCSHIYCNSCIRRSARFSKLCPLCRKPFVIRDLIISPKISKISDSVSKIRDFLENENPQCEDLNHLLNENRKRRMEFQVNEIEKRRNTQKMKNEKEKEKENKNEKENEKEKKDNKQKENKKEKEKNEKKTKQEKEKNQSVLKEKNSTNLKTKTHKSPLKTRQKN
ncbi:e3 ubiquitin-protein ligase rad18 [Anaeramoeba flamelloides]|uniref:E3 ubiquitin-protein ligase rad18 n=1 Tax=Anaeramoeba flamelloides TaxID=1746091 RepID=A0ABQ8Y8V7_9EUKA|nr:e3 ubiquitin-protein ligase rad18 [Anaeramoeba flamelloides]